MDELSWRVGLLMAAIVLALIWFASALRRAPKRRSRWERFKDEQRGGVASHPGYFGALGGSHGHDETAHDGGAMDFGGGDAGGDGGGGGGSD
jgi:uncharacterized membrane protein YgcG